MTAHVRFSFAAMAALALASTPLVAQSAGQPVTRDGPAAFAAIGVVPRSLVDSLTAVAAAPTTDTSSASSAGTAIARGPSIASARVASHAISTKPHGLPPVIQNKKSNRNAVAMMIVGGAALLVGAVIGDDAGTLVMVGGAGIGLYGLYLFLT